MHESCDIRNSRQVELFVLFRFTTVKAFATATHRVADGKERCQPAGARAHNSRQMPRNGPIRESSLHGFKMPTLATESPS